MSKLYNLWSSVTKSLSIFNYSPLPIHITCLLLHFLWKTSFITCPLTNTWLLWISKLKNVYVKIQRWDSNYEREHVVIIILSLGFITQVSIFTSIIFLYMNFIFTYSLSNFSFYIFFTFFYIHVLMIHRLILFLLWSIK